MSSEIMNAVTIYEINGMKYSGPVRSMSHHILGS